MVKVYELRPDELVLLEKAARSADDVARIEAALDGQPLTTAGSMGQLRANPLLVELRGMRTLLPALLRQLNLPDTTAADAGDGRPSSGSVKARKAARTRWGTPGVPGGGRRGA